MLLFAIIGFMVPDIIASVVGLAVAIIFHEVAHGYAALWLGDPTAKYAGRLTLNPIPHIDLWGTIIIPLLLIISNLGFVIGWAKPVPVNYYNLRNQKWGPVLVALAGPATNFLLLILFALLARFSPQDTQLPLLWVSMALTNGVLMLFNILPIPPLDGSKILYVFLEDQPQTIAVLERYGMYILFAIMFFGGTLLSQLVFGPAVALTRFFAGI